MSARHEEDEAVSGRDTSLLGDADLISYIDRADDGILVVDHEGVVRYANLVARDLIAPNTHGRLEGRHIGRPLSIDGHQRMELVTATGESLSVDARITACRFEDVSGWVLSLRPTSDAIADGLDATFHELRNHLTGMSTSLENLHEEDDYKTRDRVLDMLERRVRRMSATLDGYLDASRLAEGLFRGADEETDVALALNQYFDEVGLPAGITVSIPTGLCVLASRAHVQSVVANFVSNALKYGTAPIEIEANRVEGFIELVVRDHGPGVRPEDVESLFDRYKRASRDEARPGSGLGLWIVRSLASAYGGSSGYRDAPEQGSEFWCRLPDAPTSALHLV